MNLLIHVEINEINLLHFQKEILKWASGSISGLHIMDFDNHSESFLIDSVLKLSKEAQKIAVIIDVEAAGANSGGVVKFLNALIRLKKDNILVIINGHQDLLIKMTRVFKGHEMNLNLDAQKEKLLEFFKV